MDDRKNNSIEEDVLGKKNSRIKEDDVEISISGQAKIKGFFKKNFTNKFNDLKIKYKKDPKKFVVVAVGILIAFSSLVGSSYAYLTYVSKTANSTTINAGTLSLVFKNEVNSITLNNALPQQDDDAIANNIEYEFTIENTGSIPAQYKVTLDNICSLDKSYTVDGVSINPDKCIPNKHIKVAVKKGVGDYEVLDYKNSNNNNEYVIDAGSLGAEMEKSYKMKIWLDYDTPNTYNSNGILNVLYLGKLGLSYEQGANKLDNSGANKPVLSDNMIPVYYDSSANVWKKADSTNSKEKYKWYDYDDKMWANSVTVSETNRSTYLSAKLGTEIPMTDILTMQVWIPRFKYKVFNYNENGTATSKPQKIDVTFENEVVSTGEIICSDSLKTTGATSSETCKIKGANATCTDSTCNGKTYTHPAFNYNSDRYYGFWIGKFELSGSMDSITTKPNLSSLISQSVSTFETSIMNMNNSGNIYGLSIKDDIHMAKNSEWGAVAYLSHSRYGINGNIGINNYGNLTTGCGDEAGSVISGNCNIYSSKRGVYASTTGNVYGVYDMSGGAFEYTMSNVTYSDANNMITGKSTTENSGYTGIAGGSSFTGIAYPTDKYINKYSYGTSGSERIRSKLGDGIKEVYYGSTEGWYRDYSAIANDTNPWFVRGGGFCLDNDCAGIFSSDAYYGSAHDTISSRFVISE